jgi:hypothetical protein
LKPRLEDLTNAVYFLASAECEWARGAILDFNMALVFKDVGLQGWISKTRCNKYVSMVINGHLML